MHLNELISDRASSGGILRYFEGISGSFPGRKSLPEIEDLREAPGYRLGAGLG
jgi:hypothetical protein